MKVALGLIHRADAVSPLHARSLRAVLVRDGATTRRIIAEIDQESSANISAGRCSIVRRFLGTPADWLWMLDSDMTFGEGILDRLCAVVDPTERPIVGGLCFGVRPRKVDGLERFNPEMGTELELFPTMYLVGNDGVEELTDYPRDTVVRVHSTGAACLMVHRSVFVDDGWDDGHPMPWFREAVMAGGAVSEDQFFCLRAGALGYPVHVDTAARTGHVKTFVADEAWFDRERQR